MMDKITISLRPKERKLLDEILASDFLNIDTVEEAIQWSLGVAKIVLVELERLLEKRNLGIPVEPDIFKLPGIQPDLAPSPRDMPDKPLSVLEEIYKLSKNLG